MTTRVPYFHVYVGRRPQAGINGPWRIDALGFTPSSEYEDALNATIEKVTVEESMSGASKFTIKIHDVNMEYMFDENLYLGRYMFIDIGLVDKHKPKIDGFINSMRYEFPEDGIPVLTLEGFGTMWDAMTKDSANITNQYDNMSISEVLAKAADQYGLTVDWGRTVPANIDTLIHGLSVSQDMIKKFKSVSGSRNAYWYITAMAEFYGCFFFIHDRNLHFYPATWIDAPVDSSSTRKEAQYVLMRSKSTSPKLLSDINMSANEIMGQPRPIAEAGVIDDRIMSFWYKMDNTVPGKQGTGYNLLSFEPELTNLNMAGYFGMSMDAASGEISFSSEGTTKVADEMGYSGASSKEGTPIDVKFGKDGAVNSPVLNAKGPTGEPIVSNVTLSGDYATRAVIAEESPKAMPTRSVGATAARSNAELTSMAQASFRKWMWFAKATATVMGSADITVAIPVLLWGFGKRQKNGDIEHNGKVCGKWYVMAATHTVEARRDYLCQLELQRFWQMPLPTTGDGANKASEAPVDNKLVGDYTTHTVSPDIPIKGVRKAPRTTTL